MRRHLGEAQSGVVAAEFIDQPARLGVLAGPHAPARNPLDALEVEMPAGGDAILEAGIGGVEKALKMPLAFRRVVLERAEHSGIGAFLDSSPRDAELVP